ncbi:hypothetical protein RB628_06635 [Streptomyces sp. ADMS]|uniref:hypothetical protein n=1 Tax=Streptomyces sp. ADMS TaxID=3071415 RepID=UPI00296E9858|nr:hypothetical protein [Streptomyces sp. ADMS]MDW4905029.1 hypothetical protein [Streptomyces sp. ADMS]
MRPFGNGTLTQDVREAEERAAGHAADAVHAPLSAPTAGAPLPGPAQGRHWSPSAAPASAP